MKFRRILSILILSIIQIEHQTWRQKIASLIRMQFLNDNIKSEHGFKAAKQFKSFFIKTKFMKFFSSLLFIQN